jgi:hypothetical protein
MKIVWNNQRSISECMHWLQCSDQMVGAILCRFTTFPFGDSIEIVAQLRRSLPEARKWLADQKVGGYV